MTVLFISDLHFSRARPEKLDLFKRLLTGPAVQADALYILGDLYDDFWIGCDDKRSPNPEIIAALTRYCQINDTKLFIMRGNRDCHLNDEFAEITGAQLIQDPYLITLDGQRILLMHGDKLCTDDVKYQIWRRLITHSFIKWFYSILPLSLRQTIASNVRGYTANAVKKKSPDIIDVSIKTVIDTMKQYNVRLLIHGHTHRQAIHNVNLDVTRGKRIVLGDWYEQDYILVYEKHHFKFKQAAELIKNN